jgi:hypothetical protein
MSKLKVIAQFSFPHEAHLAKSRLEASDIPAFIADEHTISMNWLYSNAVGGVKLKVPAEFEEKAVAILKTDFTSEIEAIFGKSIDSCPKCKSNNIAPFTQRRKKTALVTILLFGLPLLFCKYGYKCNDCQFFWET